MKCLTCRHRVKKHDHYAEIIGNINGYRCNVCGKELNYLKVMKRGFSGVYG